MNYSASFADRNFVPVRLPDALKIVPTRWSKKDIGGPDLASFAVNGPESALWALTSWLRYDARITRSDGKLMWWGYISSISITAGALTLRYSIDDMTNHVRVSYTKRLEDDTKVNAITDWATDTFSYNYYGTYKDLTIRGGDMAESAAVALRDNTLETFKNFAASLEVGGGKKVSATIECKGYWKTLAWRQLTITTPNRDYYAPNQYGPYGYGVTYYPYGYQNGVQGDSALQLGSSDPLGGQDFTIQFVVPASAGVSAQRLKRLQFMFYKGNNPSFNITCDLYTDSGGSPGSYIANVGVISSTVVNPGGATLPWQPFQPSGNKPIWIIPGVTYVAVLFTGSFSPTDYVAVMGISTGYGVTSKRTIGFGWSAMNPTTWNPNFNAVTEHGESTVEIGATTARQIAAQGFQIDGSRVVSVDTVKLRMCLGNSPTDNVVMTIHADSAGDPGTLLATSTAVPYTSLSDDFEDVTFTFPTPYSLSPGVQYWFKVARSGAISSADFFIVAATLDMTANTLGLCKLYNGSAWVAVTPTVDMLFKINLVQETTQSISESIAAVGALFTGTDIQNASGTYENPATDGETTALEVIERLMAAGTSNSRRILSEVDASRRVKLFEAPASSAGATAFIDRDGHVVNQSGESIGDYCPVGVWVAPIDVARGGALAPTGASPLFYLEGMDYNPASGAITPRLKGQRDPFDLNGVK